MGAPRVTTAQKEHYTQLRQMGFSIRRAADKVGVSEAWGKSFERKLRDSSGEAWREAKEESKIDPPIPFDKISPEAREALDDLTGRLFCKRYFGTDLSPWQAETWTILEELWTSRDREFLVENVAPGLGKSTLLVMFAAKLTVKHRAIRGLFISRAQSLAERNVMRLRRALERPTPAVNAAATLSGDFGRFKPRQGDIWKRDEFVVEQMDGSPIEEKEPTWAAFGFDSEWIGNRLDAVFGDDLDSTRSTRNFEIVERNREIFDNELEARLDPPSLTDPFTGDPVGSLFNVCQQRLGIFDFSGHCLSKRLVPDDDGGDEDQPEGEPQYRHVIYKAHYEDLCRGRETHRHDAPAYPDGCLLDPRALPWRDLRKAMNNRARFAVVYQQEDADEESALVQRVWVDGGRGADGTDYPGCWDKNRGACELPRDEAGNIALAPPLLSVVACDPSPTRYWAVIWIVFHEESGQFIVMDLERRVMDAPDFLDLVNGKHVGLMEDWQQRSVDLGVPITHWIVESNAAQRWLLQFNHTKSWQRRWGTDIVPHQTGRNKLDSEFGVQSVAPHFRYGRIRLPGKQFGDPGRVAAMKLIDEVTRYPHGTTDDTVMALWMATWNIPNLVVQGDPNATMRRPRFLSRGLRRPA